MRTSINDRYRAVANATPGLRPEAACSQLGLRQMKPGPNGLRPSCNEKSLRPVGAFTCLSEHPSSLWPIGKLICLIRLGLSNCPLERGWRVSNLGFLHRHERTSH